MPDTDTRSAFLWSKILSTPFYVVFTLLPFILYKDLKASLFEITAIIILRPVVSLLAPYWSLFMITRPGHVKTYLMVANVLKFVPFLFISHTSSVWTFFVATAIYLILGRGVIPAWMELLKINLPRNSRVRVFAYGQAFDYLGIAFFPLLFGWILDSYHEAWRFLFPLTAMIGIVSTLVLLRLPKNLSKTLVSPIESWKETLVSPWTKVYALLKKHPDFASFQVGFMFGGAGLMVLQPALPVFFTDTLNLSYQELTIAISLCKGIGFAITTPLWTKWFEKTNIFLFCSVVTALAALFPLILFLSEFNLSFLYAAFLGYGMMQAGSELSWHMSGPVFSQDEDSSLYSTSNVLTQGIRGTVAPFLGYLLCQGFGSGVAMIVGGALCLMATLYMSRAYKVWSYKTT